MFNAVWQYAGRQRLLSEALDAAGATAIGRRFQLALAWRATGALLSLPSSPAPVTGQTLRSPESFASATSAMFFASTERACADLGFRATVHFRTGVERFATAELRETG